MSIKLGVNIDHVATLRQARGTHYPDPIAAAILAIQAGADSITLHPREDARHIQKTDVVHLKKILTVPMNLEIAATKEMLDFAEEILPAVCCLVPEKREEITTEGGLEITHQIDYLSAVCQRLAALNIQVSLFIDPDIQQIAAAKACGAPIIELHTGCYADALDKNAQQKELIRLQAAAKYAHQLGLIVNAGHGLHYENVQEIVNIPHLHELNIGHSIVAQAIFDGFAVAVKKMKSLTSF